jgi:hypothetical protein
VKKRIFVAKDKTSAGDVHVFFTPRPPVVGDGGEFVSRNIDFAFSTVVTGRTGIELDRGQVIELEVKKDA